MEEEESLLRQWINIRTQKLLSKPNTTDFVGDEKNHVLLYIRSSSKLDDFKVVEFNSFLLALKKITEQTNPYELCTK